MTEIIDKDYYLQHIQDENERENLRRILDLVEISKRDYSVEATDFLSPYTVRLAKTVLNRFIDSSYSIVGAHQSDERKIIMIYPDYHYLTEEDYSISAIRLEGDLDGLKHPDFLGSILGLGISRQKLGDIFITDKHVDLVVKNEIKDFILLNLKKVANKNFKAREIRLDQVKEVEDEYQEIRRSISSLRLDSYIAATYNLSRGISKKLIEAGNIKVNYEPIDRIAYELEEGDLVSTRGYGRSKLYSIDGLSKKGRKIVSIRKLI